MAFHPEDQEVLERFEQERPELHDLYFRYVDYAIDAIDAMPEARFAQHDVEPKIFPSKNRFFEVFGNDTSHLYHPIHQHRVLSDLLDRDFSDMHPEKRSRLELAA